MLFSWLRNRRRRKLLAGPFSIRWEEFLRKNVAHFARLSEPERARVRDITRILVAEKDWVGRGGLFVNEEMKVTIAATAALLIMGQQHDYYAAVKFVVVHPGRFHTPVAEDDWEDDWLSDGEADGQAVYRGPVILSWEDVHAEGTDPQAERNVVLHEFAHQLDYQDDVSSGTPELSDPQLRTRWRYAMSVAFEDHRRAVKAKEETFFSAQAAENEAEFFADATEAFYCCPHDMQSDYPELYGLFAAYYGVDPVRWFGHPGGIPHG